MDNDLIDETREAMEMLKTVIEFEPAAERIIRDEAGNYHSGKTEPFIKVGIAFRHELKLCKGAPLAVFLSICLHVNENGKAWPSVRTICDETGYEAEAVTNAVRRLKDVGLIKVTPRRGTSSVYEPVFAAYGRGKVKGMTPPENQGTRKTETHLPGKTGVVPPRKTETKEEPSKKNQEQAGADAQAHPSGKETPKSRRDGMDTELAFERMRAAGRAAGRDNAPAAHRLAGRWPHLVGHCVAFEQASGLAIRDVPQSKVSLWVKALEGHVGAGLRPEDEKTLVNLARSRKFSVYSPGSLDNLIAVMRQGAAATEQPRYKTLVS